MIRQAPAPTIRANVLAGIAKDLRRQGAPVDSLLRRHQIPAGLADPYEQLPLARFVHFLEDAALALRDVSLGARIGARLQPEEIGPIGVIFLAASNLQIALTQLASFYPVLQSGTQVELDMASGLPEYIYKIADPDIWPRRQDAELTLAAVCTAIRALLGPRWRPLEVHFEHERASLHAGRAVAQVFRAPVRFGQNVNRLIIDRQDLLRPVAQRGTELAPYMERHLMDLLGRECGFDSCSAQVAQIIGKRLGRTRIDVRSIADEIGISSRTLQRRLAEEGTSLRRLVQQHRSHRVDRLLLDRHTTITSIAHDVGYSDGTTLSRAFRNWRGRSPRQSRRPG